MDDNQPSLVDKRFPPTPTQVRQFMIAYPIIVVGGAGWFRESSWFWWIAVFCAIGWLSAVWQFLANSHRREGYSAALEDISHDLNSRHFQDEMLAGNIPLVKRSDL